MRIRARWCLLMTLLVAVAGAQTPANTRYEPVFSNGAVGVFALELPPGARAASFQNEHDVLWIALDVANVTFLDSDRRATEVRFAPGDVRFFGAFATASLVNTGGSRFRGVLVQLKKRATGATCGCGSKVERSVCGCPGAARLPPLWALALGNVTVAGTTLPAGEGFAQSADRDDTLLVAVTALDLRDEPGAAPSNIQLQPGQAVWIAAGAHRLRNTGAAPARFVTVEF